MEKHLDRIATAFERIASAFESISRDGLEVYAKPSCFNLTLEGDVSLSLSGHLNLQGPLLLQHEFPHDIPLGLLQVVPNARAFKVELSNCSDTETPFAIQTNG
jgi:hypothetical protein